jgi:hypothetical protein
MNTIRLHDKVYKYESFWRSKKSSRSYDSNDKLLPYPKANVKWQNRKMFIEKLKQVESYLKTSRSKYIQYDKEDYKDCLLCDKKHITKGLYDMNRIRWEDGLEHYISIHKIRPSDEFVDRVFKFTLGRRIKSRITKLNGRKIIKYNKSYLKLDRNQLLILDALMQHGSKRSYMDTSNRKLYRYSEHAGLLDFNEFGLEKVLVSGNTSRVDENDDEIFLPNNMDDAFDYEYIFHTHPATPKAGGRVHYGILYEFPSISDMFHFMDHYNEGNTQGSIIICAEGLYLIRKKNHDNKDIIIDEDKFYRDSVKTFNKVQDQAIKKYGDDFSDYVFYSKIAQDKNYINQLNKVFNRYKMQVDYYPRIKNKKGQWIIDTLYLPIYVKE